MGRGFFRGEGIPPWRRGQISWDHFKNDPKINKKSKYFSESKEQQ